MSADRDIEIFLPAAPNVKKLKAHRALFAASLSYQIAVFSFFVSRSPKKLNFKFLSFSNI
jgi:hypothetical protein